MKKGLQFIFLVGLGLFVSCILFGCSNSSLDEPSDYETPNEDQPSGGNSSGGDYTWGNNPSSGNTSPSNPIAGEEGSKKVLFNLAGATALATSENESSAYYGVRAARIARAANSGDNLGILAKVLSDGSLESVIESDYDVTFPPIQYIMQSPSQINNQLYIIFPNDVRSDGYYKNTYYDENGNVIGTNTTGEWINGAWSSSGEWVDGDLIMGKLVCVYSDGSYVNILSNNDGVKRNLEQLSEPIVFDDYGYMYYIAYEYTDGESTRIIYRYNPTTKESEQLSVGMKNYSYSKIQVSNDGFYIFVQGSNGNNNSSFLKAIPVGSPNSAQDLIYSSDYLYVGDWIYDDESDAVYVTSSTTGKEGLLKFTKDSSGYFTGSSYKNLSNSTEGGNSGAEEDVYPYDDVLEKNMMGNYYTWRVEHLDSNGKVNAKKVIEEIVSYINDKMPTDGFYYYDIYDTDGTLVKSMAKFESYYSNYSAYCYADAEGNLYNSNYTYNPIRSDNDGYYYYDIYDTDNNLVKSEAKFYNSYNYYSNQYWCYLDADGNGYKTNYTYEQRYKEADGYKYITVDDIDIRFDNPNLKKCDYSYGNYDCTALVNDMKGLKNEDAIKALTSKQLSLLNGIRWSNRYNEYGNDAYKNIFIADILYIKGSDTLLCDDPYYKHFKMSSASDKYFSEYRYDLFNNTTQINTPRWNDEYYTADDTLDCSKILDYFYSFSMIEEDKSNYEFRLSGLENDSELEYFYSELKNTEAIDYIFSDPFMASDFYNKFCWKDYYYNEQYLPIIVKFIAKTCFVKGTDKSIISIPQESEGEGENAYYPYWGSVSNLKIINGQLWAIDNNWGSNPKLVCLVDNNIYVGRIPAKLKDFRIKDIQLFSTNLYFKNIITDSSGGETGKQDIRKYEIENDTVVNLFDRLHGKDNYTVETMSIAEPNLYVCLSQGLTVSNYRIDTETGRMETLATSEKFKQIISFRM